MTFASTDVDELSLFVRPRETFLQNRPTFNPNNNDAGESLESFKNRALTEL